MDKIKGGKDASLRLRREAVSPSLGSSSPLLVRYVGTIWDLFEYRLMTGY